MTVKTAFTREKKGINPLDIRKNGTMECEKGKGGKSRLNGDDGMDGAHARKKENKSP